MTPPRFALRRGLIALALAFAAFGPAGAQRAPGDSAAVAGVVSRFHQSLAAGDSATVLELLAEDVTVLEGGTLEGREHYREHHLPADIAFAKSSKLERGLLSIRLEGDVAWSIGSSTVTRMVNGRQVKSRGVELIVLVRRSGGHWRIAVIHWSSGRAESDERGV